MNNKRTARAALIAGLCATTVCLRPTEAKAYCADSTYFGLWKSKFPDFVIPVYISTGPQTGVLEAGLTFAEAERFVIEMIGRHNESSVGPIFYYAGPTNQDMDHQAMSEPSKFANRPFGITLDSYSCDIPTSVCGEKALACMGTAKTLAKARVTLAPAGCNNGVGVPAHSLSNNDTATATLHEFGHSMGLLHSNQTDDACSPNHLFGGDPDGNDGVMRAVIGGNFPALREWRRDDIEGLRAVYPGSTSTEIAYWDDSIFPAAPSDQDLTSIIGQAATRPPTLSSAASAGESPIYLVTTNESNEVVVLVDEGTGFGPPEVVENGAAGRTWGNPTVAAGESSVLVSWSSGEEQGDASVVHRWGVKDLQSQTWTYNELAGSVDVKRIGAGYAGLNIFVLSTLRDYSSNPVIITIDADAGTPLEVTVVDGVEAFDIGSLGCFTEFDVSYCAIPYSVNSLDGIHMGWIDIEVTAQGMTVLEHEASEVPASGRLGLTSRPDLATFRGTGGNQRYELLQIPGLGSSGLPAPPILPTLDAAQWPVAVGSLAPMDGPIRWVGAVRREVQCGNAIVQGLEQCDDGNLDDTDECPGTCLVAFCGDGFVLAGVEECDDGNNAAGDGCNEQCSVEMDAGTDTGTDGGTGGGAEFPQDGCNCRARPAGGLSPSALVLLFVWWRRRLDRAAQHPDL